MVRCPRCGRHHRVLEERCPFCSRAGVARTITGVVTACVSSIVLMACYGAPPYDMKDTDTGLPDSSDIDGDGILSPEDCDDTNAAVHPGAVEDCKDLIDNDCDKKTDSKDEDCL